MNLPKWLEGSLFLSLFLSQTPVVGLAPLFPTPISFLWGHNLAQGSVNYYIEVNFVTLPLLKIKFYCKLSIFIYAFSLTTFTTAAEMSGCDRDLWPFTDIYYFTFYRKLEAHCMIHVRIPSPGFTPSHPGACKSSLLATWETASLCSWPQNHSCSSFHSPPSLS